MSDLPQRYHSFIIILHWLMGLAFIGMLASGLTMEYADLDRSVKFSLYQLHKSVGVLLLVCFALRLGARLLTHIPALPARLKPLEAKLAKLGHFALYLLMFGMPMSGWIMVSTSSSGFPTMVFNLFEWPHIPGIAGDKPLNEAARTGHMVMGFTLLAVLFAHIGAVIKHGVIDRINLLPRMWWS